LDVAELRISSMILAGDFLAADSSVTHHWQIANCLVWKRSRRLGLQQIWQSSSMSGGLMVMFLSYLYENMGI